MSRDEHNEHTDKNTDDLVAGNAAYAEQFDAGHLEAPPRRRLAVLTCMDARVVPHAALGMEIGDMHVVRNAGGRVTDDAERSLMVSTRLLGVERVAVMHHTSCGNAGTDDDIAAKLAATGLEQVPRPLHANGPDAVAKDVRRLRDSELLAPGVTVEGFVFDVATGRVEPARVD